MFFTFILCNEPTERCGKQRSEKHENAIKRENDVIETSTLLRNLGQGKKYKGDQQKSDGWKIGVLSEPDHLECDDDHHKTSESEENQEHVWHEFTSFRLIITFLF